jgi:hypothetical protein
MVLFPLFTGATRVITKGGGGKLSLMGFEVGINVSLISLIGRTSKFTSIIYIHILYILLFIQSLFNYRPNPHYHHTNTYA